MIDDKFITAIIIGFFLNSVTLTAASIIGLKAYDTCSAVNEKVKDPVQTLKDIFKKPE